MNQPTFTPETLASAGIGAYFRPKDIEPLGVTFRDLKGLVDKEIVQKVGPGLYRLIEVEPEAFETLAMVASVAPNGIICLLSALRLHEIGTQAPHEVWLALDRKARKPVNLPARVRIVRFSGPALTYGIGTRLILGGPVRVTSPARTVVDCFRYRRKLGLDIALEALRDAVSSRIVTMDEITRAAEICRARTVMKPYLEALAL